MSAPALSMQHATPARAEPQTAERVRDVAAAPTRLFLITRRVDLALLSRWQRVAYTWLCRRLPAEWRVPPAPPMARGGFLTFDEADENCLTPDDQIHVLPLGWSYGGDKIDAEEVCRPRDPTDEGYKALKAKYACESPPGVADAALKAGALEGALASLPPETRAEVERLLSSLSELAS